MTPEEIKEDNRKLKEEAAWRKAELGRIEKLLEADRAAGDFKKARIMDSIVEPFRQK